MEGGGTESPDSGELTLGGREDGGIARKLLFEVSFGVPWLIGLPDPQRKEQIMLCVWEGEAGLTRRSLNKLARG